jgi:hypothetical protein
MLYESEAKGKAGKPMAAEASKAAQKKMQAGIFNLDFVFKRTDIMVKQKQKRKLPKMQAAISA